jgi:hypothetical protein
MTMDAVTDSETSGNFKQAKRRRVQEDFNLQSHVLFSEREV